MPADLLAALLPAGSLPDDVRADYLARVRDQPAGTFTEAVQLNGTVDQVPRAVVRCAAGAFSEEIVGDPIAACAARARAEGWAYRELQIPHDPQVFDPAGIATILDELCCSVSEWDSSR